MIDKMEKEFWHSKWQTNDIAFDQASPNPLLIKYLDSLHLKTGARIFVPLCGKSIDMHYLLEQNYQIVGVELSLEACEMFFLEQNLKYQIENTGSFVKLQSDKITLLAGDIFKLDKNILGKFSAIYDRAALVALPKEMRKRYVDKIITLSENETEILLITGSYNQSEMQGPPFSVDEQEVISLYGKDFQITVLNNEIAEIPKHLLKRGLKSARQHVFKLEKT